MANPATPTKQKPSDAHHHESSPDHPDVASEHIQDGTELGNVQIHNNVIATIARLAALKVPGVVEMGGGIVEGIAGMISKKGADRGIRVEVGDNSVTLELRVILEYGVRIPHVAWQLQTDTRQAVEQMTGKAVKAVEVVVEGVKIAAPQRRTPEMLAEESAI